MEKKPFTIAHISDFHMCSPKGIRVKELINKRISGYLSWQLHRRTEHKEVVLEKLIAELGRIKPDHIVITGDLTHLSLSNEFRKVKYVLRTLGPPSRVSVIPGNHDAYVNTSWDDTFAFWEDYMASDEAYRFKNSAVNSRSAYPSLRVRGSTALIGLSTARPSAPFLAIGSIGKEQLKQLETLLLMTRQKNLFRIILIHHPPVSGVVGWRKRLTDAKALRDTLKRCGAELVLHGHAHRRSQTQIKTPDGHAFAIGVPSASAFGGNSRRRARYHLYHLTQTVDGWELRLSVRGYSPRQDQFIAEDDYRLI
jgi:3',5'-cyclic AMP phosphodiesterase CpdA